MPVLSIDDRTRLIDEFCEMLNEPTCDIRVERGFRRIDDGSPWIKYASTPGVTLTLRIHGGADALPPRQPDGQR